MSATTVGAAVARKTKADQLVSWLRSQQDDLAMAAASHIKPSTIVRVAQGALRKDDKLMAAAIANPLSLLHCCLDAARLGHEPGTDQYYLVPFGSEVTGIEGYKGIIERMYRAGAVSSVVAEVVYQRDTYRRTGATTPPVHEFDEFADPEDRGPLRGSYAYAVMLDGRHSKVIAMGRAEVMKHKAMSKGSDRSDSPWKRWEESMWKKCPLRGLEPYVPTSSEWLVARAQATAAAARPVMVGGFTPPAPAPEPEDIHDAEIVDENPAARDDTQPGGEPQGGRDRGNRGAPPPAPQDRAPRATKGAVAELDRLLRQFPWQDNDQDSFLAWRSGGQYTASRQQVDEITAYLRERLDAAGGDTEQAVSDMWAEYQAQAAGGQDAAEAGQEAGSGE